jgi:uncharacterized protein YjiS (DUF1127 family)
MKMPMQFPLDAASAPGAETSRLLHTLRVAVRRFIARWRRHRRAAEMSASLHALDARTLRDLGFHRSEIDSVIAEISGDAESTRRRCERALRYPYY